MRLRDDRGDFNQMLLEICFCMTRMTLHDESREAV